MPAIRPSVRMRICAPIATSVAILGPPLLSAPVFAADTDAGSSSASGTSSASADENQLQEVLVTANKRVEDTREVPVSIGVIDGKELIDLHIDDVEDISRFVPGVSFAAHNNGPNGPGQDNITIRGVSSTVGNPTVATYIDEVPIITITGYEGVTAPKLIDVDRIEVLRGPQGTLYGASSEGGTVRYLTTQPDSHSYSGWFRQELSGTEHGGFNYNSLGVLNIPVVEDVFALRVSAEYEHESGYINHYGLEGSLALGTGTAGALLQKGVNDDNTLTLTVKGLWTPTDNASVTPSLIYQRMNAGDSSTFEPALGLYNEFNQVPGTDHDALLLPSLTVKAGFGFADFTSVTGFVNRVVNRQSDGTFFNTAAVAAFYLDTATTAPYTTNAAANNNVLGNIPSPVTFNDHFNTFSQELRLSSPESWKKIKWVGGLFFSNQQWTHLDYEPAPGFSAAFQGIYGYPINTDPVLNPTVGTAGFNPNFWQNDLIWEVYDHNYVKQYAAFGQIDIELLSNLHLGLGDRYVRATEQFTEFGSGFFEFGNAGAYGQPLYAQSTSFSTSTPKFTLTYDVTPEASLYASAGKGFRLGGATTPNTNAACVAGLAQLGLNNAPKEYGPDHLWSYELGGKSLLFQKTLSVNADVYYIDWTSIQQTITIPICGGALNDNVGNAKAFGGELEVRYKPTFVNGLTLGLNMGAEHAYITSSNNLATVRPGQDVLYTPNLTATALANYVYNFTDTLKGFLRADYEYTGSSYGSFIVPAEGAPNPAYIDPSYNVVNLNLGIDWKNYEIAVFAKNLLDNSTILQSPVVNSVAMGYTLRPLTAGIAFQAKLP
jgi:iron complex outermembrane recepter protein